MEFRSAIEVWPGFQTVAKQRLANTPQTLNTISAESFLSRPVKNGSAGRVFPGMDVEAKNFSMASPHA